MSFDFTKHIEKMRQTVDYRAILRQYEASYGKIANSFRDTTFYREYVGRFRLPEGMSIIVPKALENEADQTFFSQLVTASFSTAYVFHDSEESPEKRRLFIATHPSFNEGDEVVELADLNTETIEEMFDIYLIEQMNLFVKKCNPLAKLDILFHQQCLLDRFHRLAYRLPDDNGYYKELVKRTSRY